MSDERLELVRRNIERYSRGDFEESLEALSNDVEWVVAKEHPAARTLHGVDELLAYHEDWQRTMPGLLMEIVSNEEQGDVVLTVCRLHGRGAEAAATVAFLTRFQGEEIFRVEEYLDPAEARRAI